MKRITVFFAACAAFSCAALFAAPKPSIDGRAVVADFGVLPKGPYGKSIGFLPGDSVTVTNPAVGVSVDVMILGALDSSEGIAILLSPEAADTLFIAKDSQSLVTITKKGAASDAPPVVQSSAVASASNSSTSRASPAATKVDPDADAFRALPSGIAEKFGDTPAETRGAQAERAASGSVPEPTAPVAERPARVAEVGEDNGFDWDSVVYDEPSPEIASNTGVFHSDLLPTPSSASAPQPASPAPSVNNVQPAPPAPSASAPESATPPVPPTAAPVVSREPDPQPANPAPAAPPPSPQDNLDSIVLLIPTEPKPPVSSGNALPSAAQSVQPPKPAEPSAPNPPAKPESSVPIAWTQPEPVQRVMRIQSLERGKYYVQIATFSNPESVKTVAAKYGDKYPLVQIVNDAAASSQILVGPLGADEYGAVLARFKAYGYTDAFLRTGK